MRASIQQEIIVDSFAGGGGASAGIEMAVGRSPDVAINHDAIALAMHAINHPQTLHLPHNVWKVDPTAVCGSRSVGLLWASPDCKHFSKAKGGKPVEKSIRDLAWVVVRWARQVSPRVIMLENVEEFSTWGPLGDDGRPCPDRKGQEFKRWIGELKRCGYKVDWRELRACDYGAPTIRKRLFLIARRDGLPIVWPAPTHGNPKSAEVKAGKLKPWRTAAEIIDWSLPCHSIFLTRDEARVVGVKRPLAEATMARIAKGVHRYVIKAEDSFIVSLTHHGGDRCRAPITEPAMTLTAAHRGEKAIVLPTLAAPFVTGCGGRMGQSEPRGCEQPAQTLTAKADSILVAPHLMTMRNSQKPHNEANKPTHVITAGGAHLNLVSAFLTKFRKNSVGSAADEPMHTVTANSYIDRPGGCAPIGLVSVFLAKHYGDIGQRPGSEMAEPVSTVTASDHNALVAAHLSHQYGSGAGEGDPSKPIKTVTGGGQHAAIVAAFMQKYYGSDQDPRLDDPLHTATTKDRFGLVMVTINGEPYFIADIGMRMLAPRELFGAQGFPPSYIIDRGFRVDDFGQPFTDGRDPQEISISKTDQVRMCGNSVCPPMAAALVKANYQPMDVAPRAEPEFNLEAAE
ncbi:MAG: DNA cytosine methyltransferase [Xanthobacteraceae bacterium]